MIDPFEKLARLRALYPEDIGRIEEDEERVAGLLRMQAFSQQPLVEELLALCRKDILAARKMLATDRALSADARAEAWSIIDARLWFVQLIAKDYEGELAQLDRELQAELSK